MHSHWYNCPALLTPKECQMVIDHARKRYPAQEGVIGHGEATKADTKMRTSTIRWLSYCDLDLLWLRLRIEEKILVANRHFGYDLQPSFTEIQFTEYHAESPEVVRWRNRSATQRAMDWLARKAPPANDQAEPGHYNWHEDCSAVMKRPMDRKLSFVLQLSERADYVGGEFEMAGDPLPAGAFTQRGDALIFRSGLRHRVLPVTSGTRYSLVTWVHGPRR